MSTDPALGDYVPEAGKGNTKDSANLPGMGGVYNIVNFNLYHYGSNNPVKYVDPDGRTVYSDDESQNSFILNDIILSAGNGFYFDDNNILQIDEKADPGDLYSKEIRDSLISFINGEKKDINLSIKYSEFYTENVYDFEGNLQVVESQNFGASSYGDKNGLTFRVCVPNNLEQNTNGESASIFIHEFYGHIVPTGEGEKNANAVKKTMPLIDFLGIAIPEFLKDYWLDGAGDFHDGALPSVEEQGWIEK